MQMLESLIDDEEKDSAKLLTEMSSKVQGVKEKVQTYVLDMINLRKRILKMAIEEGNPLSEVLVRKWCTHAILVGLRLDPIRLEMRVILKDPMIEEHEVMKKVKELVKMEKEHLQKMGEDGDDDEEENFSTKGKNGNKSNSNASKKTGEVNHINASDGWRNRNRDEKGKGVSLAGEAGKLEIDGSVLNAKLDLITNQMGECMEVIPAVRSLETDMRDLKKQMADMKNQSRRPFPFPSCEECKKTNTKCTHCAKCGQSGHKQTDAVCPKKLVNAGPEGDGLAFKATPVRAADVGCVCQTSSELERGGECKPELRGTEDVGLLGDMDASSVGTGVVRDVSVSMLVAKDAEVADIVDVREKHSMSDENLVSQKADEAEQIHTVEEGEKLPEGVIPELKVDACFWYNTAPNPLFEASVVTKNGNSKSGYAMTSGDCRTVIISSNIS